MSDYISQTITVSSCQSDISNQCRIKTPCITGMAEKSNPPPRGGGGGSLGPKNLCTKMARSDFLKGKFRFWFTPWRAGNAILSNRTRKSSRNQESEQSSATIVPQWQCSQWQISFFPMVTLVNLVWGRGGGSSSLRKSKHRPACGSQLPRNVGRGQHADAPPPPDPCLPSNHPPAANEGRIRSGAGAAGLTDWGAEPASQREGPS